MKKWVVAWLAAALIVGGAVYLWQDDPLRPVPVRYSPTTKQDDNVPLEVKRSIKGGN